MPGLNLFLLGAPHVERNGTPIEVDTRKAIALLAYLAVTRRVHSRDALATLLWPEHDQARARAVLRRTLSALNKALDGDYLNADAVIAAAKAAEVEQGGDRTDLGLAQSIAGEEGGEGLAAAKGVCGHGGQGGHGGRRRIDRPDRRRPARHVRKSRPGPTAVE